MISREWSVLVIKKSLLEIQSFSRIVMQSFKNFYRFLVMPKCEKLFRNILTNGLTNDQRCIYT